MLPTKRGSSADGARRGSPDPAADADRRSPTSLRDRGVQSFRRETYGPAKRRGRETRAERVRSIAPQRGASQFGYDPAGVECCESEYRGRRYAQSPANRYEASGLKQITDLSRILRDLFF